MYTKYTMYTILYVSERPWLFLAENLDTLSWIRVSGKQDPPGPVQSTTAQSLYPDSRDPVPHFYLPCHSPFMRPVNPPAPKLPGPQLSQPLLTDSRMDSCRNSNMSDHGPPEKDSGSLFPVAPPHLTHPVPLSGPITGLTGGWCETRGSWRGHSADRVATFL